MTGVVGVLLAAGSGRRMGRPKALVRDAAGDPWLCSAHSALIAGGCAEVVVVLGAAAAEARPLVPGARIVEAADWATGMGASLRTGLEEIADDPADAALIHLVDLPDVGPQVVRRMLANATPTVLARATYNAGPGHPALIGREHWAAVAAEAAGDHGARDYLARHDVIAVDCSDLATGADVDEPGPLLGR